MQIFSVKFQQVDFQIFHFVQNRRWQNKYENENSFSEATQSITFLVHHRFRLYSVCSVDNLVVLWSWALSRFRIRLNTFAIASLVFKTKWKRTIVQLNAFAKLLWSSCPTVVRSSYRRSLCWICYFVVLSIIIFVYNLTHICRTFLDVGRLWPGANNKDWRWGKIEFCETK